MFEIRKYEGLPLALAPEQCRQARRDDRENRKMVAQTFLDAAHETKLIGVGFVDTKYVKTLDIAKLVFRGYNKAGVPTTITVKPGRDEDDGLDIVVKEEY